ncbi:MAG: type III-B CRISPR-associated protein Cas10/Cmr2 [Ignavibacteria bacterium]|nr:type III-B CRISPR-associated protein Cas10/Cmr2 [Ignavibacteria bacterium]
MDRPDKNFSEKLKTFLHDPIDKVIDIPDHIERAKHYADLIGISEVDVIKGPDQIASCMERSLLPKEQVYTDFEKEDLYQAFNELRHPLSAEKLEVEISLDNKNISNLFENVYQRLSRKISNFDDKLKFFYLWRNLLDELYENQTDNDWLKYLPLLPADTRIPDHSIWEHIKIASAINAFYDKENKLIFQKNSLFLFSLGPVQSFIHQARKTQDFYMGSYLLSYFTFLAITEIIDRFGPTAVIYPDLYKQPLADWYFEKQYKMELKNSLSFFADLPTIPNRFVSIIPEIDKDYIEELVKDIQNKIRNEIKLAKEKIISELGIKLSKKLNDSLDYHLSDFPQIYWVALPWRLTQQNNSKDLSPNDLKDFFEEDEIEKWNNLWSFVEKNGEHLPNIGLLYQLLYTTLEKAHASRKNLRNFSFFQETGIKCSICGEKNVLFFYENENPKKFLRYNPDAFNFIKQYDFPRRYLTEGEGLCGICFFKRTFDIYLTSLGNVMYDLFKNFSFPSTSEVAIASFKLKALTSANKELRDYESELSQKKFPKCLPLPKLKSKMNYTIEGMWFFEENLRSDLIEAELGIKLSEEEIGQIKLKLNNLVKKVGKPNPYYAIIHLDGDSMGKWLSGDLLPSIDTAYNTKIWEKLPEDFKAKLQEHLPKKFLSPSIHAAISNALRNYTIEFVRKIVEEEHLGKLIYAGGDDLLAFVNLEDLLDVIEKLRWAFSGHIKFQNGQIIVDKNNTTGFVEKEGKLFLTMGPSASASMGIVIAHYKEPLKIVINKVFEMEKEAKNGGRNRFAILLLTKSGEPRKGVFNWIDDEKNLLLTDLMKNIKSMINENASGYISHRFIKTFKSEFMKLKNEQGHFSGSEQIIKTILKRLVSRAYNSELKEGKKEFCDKFLSYIWRLYGASEMNIDYFVNIIEILSFMNRGD